MNRRTFLKLTALAGVGSILPLSACSGSDSPGASTTVFTNGTIYLDAVRTAKNLAVRNGRVSGYNLAVTDVGAATIVDLQGGCLYPGFHDSHNHLLETSLAAGGPDLTGLKTADAFAAKIRQTAATSPDGAPIMGIGFTLDNYNGWGLNDLATIDAASGNHPVILMDNLGHNAIANTITLQLAKVTPATPAPFAGSLGIQNSKLTGMLRETAMTLVGSTIMGMFSDDAILGATEKILNLWASYGYTSINDMMGTPMGRLMRPQIFRKLENLGKLGVRVNCSYTIFSLDDIEDAREYVGQDTDMVRFTGCKIFIDGAFAAGQAWTSWQNLQGGNGVYYVRPDDSKGKQYNLNRIVDRVDELGMHLHYHVQGDQGIETILNALDAVIAARGRLNSVHTLIHLALPRQDQLVRMQRFGAQLNVTMQPALYQVEAGAVQYYGAERIKQLYPISRLVSAGIATGISTDFSVSPLSLAPALTVIRMALQSPGYPLTLEQTVQGLTAGSAATVPKRDTGSLKIGNWADMVAFSRDLSTVEPAKLDDPTTVRRIATWVGGRQTA